MQIRMTRRPRLTFRGTFPWLSVNGVLLAVAQDTPRAWVLAGVIVGLLAMWPYAELHRERDYAVRLLRIAAVAPAHAYGALLAGDGPLVLTLAILTTLGATAWLERIRHSRGPGYPGAFPRARRRFMRSVKRSLRPWRARLEND